MPMFFERQHKWKTAWTTSLVLAAGTIALIFGLHTPHFQASVLIDIEATAPYIAFSDGKVTDRSIHYIETQLELLQSPVVLAPVVTRPEIAALDEFQTQQALTLNGQPDPIVLLQKHLAICQVGKSQLYQINYSSLSAQDSADIANAVVAEYLKLQSDEEFRRTQRVIDLLENELLRRSLNVERLRTHVLELAKELTGKDPFSEIVVDPNKNMGLFGTLYQSLMKVEVDRAVLLAEVKSLRDAPLSNPDQTKDAKQLDLNVANHSELHQRQAMLDEIYEQMKHIKLMVEQLDSHAGYERLQTDFGEAINKMSELKILMQKRFSNKHGSSQAKERTLAIESLDHKLAQLDVKKNLLTIRLKEHLKDSQANSNKSVQLAFARTELAREEKVFELIAIRKLALQTELRAPARVRLRQAASVPLKPFNPIPYKKLLVGCLIAFASPLALALIYRPAKSGAK
jgi:hypothetical protein